MRGCWGEVRAELEDRYVRATSQRCTHLLEAASLRLQCERTGVAQVDRKRDQIHVRFTGQANIDPGRLDEAGGAECEEGCAVLLPGSASFSA